jgi:hypothetical protein
MLLHVILACKSFVAVRTNDVLFAGMLLPVAGCMTGSGERVGAIEARSVWTRVFVLGCELRSCLWSCWSDAI